MAIVSDSSGLRESVISVPIYSCSQNDTNNKNNNILISVWGGALDFDVFNKSLQSLNNLTVIYIDQYGQKVADSDKGIANKVESLLIYKVSKMQPLESLDI
jgi:hypothetical protein